MHCATQPRRFVDPDDELVLPLHQRTVAQYARDSLGATELRLFYGDKEISFDEPELFAFGETLAKQSRFVARSAMQWAAGQTWPRIQGLLEQLVEEGILRMADALEQTGEDAPPGGARPSPLPPAHTQVPHSWSHCEQITRALTGRSLELGYLELVVPIFRVAHMEMDADGRQVGEANVFPKALRLDVPTNWRACIYPGTRYLDPRPMNVTALKGMRADWGQIMACLARIREAYLARFPDARNGLTVGHLERLSTVVLAVPTYALMRAGSSADKGRLHPALSSLFRVTDGLRMTMHQMLFIPIGEPTVLPDAPINSAEILDYAERNFSFHSEHGVCAGPRVMMEEFLAVIVDGKLPRESAPEVLAPAVQQALDDLPSALDYGLYGLQAFAATFSLWPVMARAYERLWQVANDWHSAGGHPRVAQFLDRFRETMEALKTASYLAAEQWRVDREKVYADMYAQCGLGLRTPQREASLSDQLAPRRGAGFAETERQLRNALTRFFEQAAVPGDAHFESFVACLLDYMAREQAILRVACAVQKNINTLLGRVAPKRPFSAADIDIHVQLQGREARPVPNLGDVLQQLLGVRMRILGDSIEIAQGA